MTGIHPRRSETPTRGPEGAQDDFPSPCSAHPRRRSCRLPGQPFFPSPRSTGPCSARPGRPSCRLPGTGLSHREIQGFHHRCTRDHPHGNAIHNSLGNYDALCPFPLAYAQQPFGCAGFLQVQRRQRLHHCPCPALFSLEEGVRSNCLPDQGLIRRRPIPFHFPISEPLHPAW